MDHKVMAKIMAMEIKVIRITEPITELKTMRHNKRLFNNQGVFYFVVIDCLYVQYCFSDNRQIHHSKQSVSAFH